MVLSSSLPLTPDYEVGKDVRHTHCQAEGIIPFLIQAVVVQIV